MLVYGLRDTARAQAGLKRRTLLNGEGEESVLVGTTWYKMGGADAHTPEFPRGGLSAVFGFEVLDVVASPNLTVTIEHRSEVETSFDSVDTFALITTAGTFTKEVSALKEIIRLKLSFAGGDVATVGVRFLVPAPMWLP